MALHRGWVGFDFDGTVAEYTNWLGDYEFGAPIPAAIDRMKALHEMQIEVRIVTARVAPNDPSISKRERDPQAIGLAISDYILLHAGFRPKVQHYKDFLMIELWDDRAVQVTPNTGKPVEGSVSSIFDLEAESLANDEILFKVER